MIQINQVYIMCLFEDQLLCYEFYIHNSYLDFPSDSVVKNLPARQETQVPWVRKIPWEGTGSPLQFSCLRNPTERGVWQAISPQAHKRLGHT